MSAKENIAVEEKIVAAFNQGNMDILDEVSGPNYVFHGPTNPDWDRESIKVAIRMMHSAFPDWKITLEDILATEDKAALRISIVGTHLGELWGVKATGKTMHWSAIIIDHFANGKIVEEWEWADFEGLMRQLGLIPELVGA